jgi:very-short-patch-repair endonuclease
MAASGCVSGAQHPVGSFVLDFYCPTLRLAVEVDGAQHAYWGHAQRDDRRTRWLAQRGVTVLRIPNSEVFDNIEGVIQAIAEQILSLKSAGVTPTRRWRADLPLARRGRTTPVETP